ncbi:MAG: OprD family outer membrane porin [Thermodesulfobacteriota bacterium]|nr:OprD family outer membrane porin [Thermodesulfobacteriota bacterium]
MRQLRMKVCIAVVLGLVLMTNTATADESKRKMKNNMTEVYNVLPGAASNLSEAFTKGEFYGRIRLNSFYWEYDDGSKHDPTGFGLGGSAIYKSAPFHGVSGTAGFYMSHNLGLLDKEDALFGRSGKGTFSRYDKLEDGDWGMTVLAQAYLQYHFRKTDIKIGRQIFESFLTKSNDTKMIPNTFEGYTLVSTDIPETTVKLGFLTAQKLRDHTEFHDVITYNDGKNNTYSKWNNQDDSAVHKGLSYANLKAAGEDVDNELVVAGVTNESFDHLKLDAWYNGVPDLFYSLMAECNYTISLSDGWSLTPGLRYMQQFDKGAGKVGGAALTGTLVDGSGLDRGYEDPDSVDAKLYAARLVLKKGAGRLLAGYSKISDDADFITPWRGFPTAGYTRAMAQYNWEADTESWMIQAFYDFGKAGIVKGFRTSVDYAYMNYDDEKEELGGHKKTDRSSIHADLWYILPFLPELEAKFRIASINAERTTSGDDPSYREFRFELNYLF